MSRKPVLIVDDEPIVREAIRDWLIDAGYEVVTAETGEEALELLTAQDFGVTILDIRLPGKTGIRVLRDIKATKPDIKSIIITAYPTAELDREARELGVIDYLVKPVAPDDLERLVRDTLIRYESETEEAR